MNPTRPPELSPEDLMDARVLFNRIFHGILPFRSLNFYLPDHPQSALTWKEGGDLEEVLKSSRIHNWEMHYDEAAKRLFYPLTYHQRPLGFLVFFDFPQAPTPREEGLIQRLSGLALEMLSLKKQVQLDPVTGFFHEAAFRKHLIRSVKEALGGQDGGARKKRSLADVHPDRRMVLGFLALEYKGPSLKGDGPYDPLPASWIKDLKRCFPKGTIMAAVRHHPLIIGFLVSETPGEDDALLPFGSEAALALKDWEGGYYLGWAALQPWEQESFQGNPSPYGLVNRWWEQAWTALQAARGLGMKGALGYHEVLFRAGRVMDILPGHRIVINLGERAGVKYHMRLAVGDGGEGKAKGVAVPLDIQEDLSIAEIIYLEESGGTPRKNDSVRLIAAETPLPEELGPGKAFSQGPLRSFQMFQQKFRQALPEVEKFSLILGRLDDYAERLRLWGEQGTEEMRKEMQVLLMKALPPHGVMGPYGRDGFILFLPEKGQEEIGDWAKDLIERFQKELNLSVSLGVAGYPCRLFHKGEIMENVIKTLDHLAFLPPRSLVLFDSVTLNISGDKAYDLGELEEAIREYERAVILDPGNLNALNSLGVAYAHQGRMEEAVGAFRQVLGQAPEDFMASFNLGFALVRLGRSEEAARLWEDLAEKSDPDFDLYYHLGCLYRDGRDYPRAYAWFRRAEEAPNRKGMIYRHLGETLEHLGKGKEAMVWYKKALKHQPQNAFCLSRLGTLYLDQQESIRVALSLCRQAVRIEPARGTYWLALGRALLANDRPQEALEVFHKAADRGAPLKETYRLLGQTCRVLGRQKEAREFFVLALKQDPEDPELQGCLREEEKEGKRLSPR